MYLTNRPPMFDNGSFQVWREWDNTLWLGFGDEYAFDIKDLQALNEFLAKADVPILPPVDPVVATAGETPQKG